MHTMHTTVTTTITNRIDLNTLQSDVTVEIDAGDTEVFALGTIYAAVIGGMRATFGSLHEARSEQVETAVRSMCEQFGIALAEGEEG